MLKEVWKDIKDYEGLYQVSSHGRVRTLSRKVRGMNDTFRTVKGKLVDLKLGKSPYLQMHLWRENKRKVLYIHELVANHFIGSRPKGKKGKHIRHKDNNPINNYFKNLTYSSAKRNAKDRLKADMNHHGENIPSSKLTFEQVGKIRKIVSVDNSSSVYALADIFKVCPHTIYSIIKGSRWNPERLRLNIIELEKNNKIKEAKRIKEELRIICPAVWVDWLKTKYSGKTST